MKRTIAGFLLGSMLCMPHAAFAQTLDTLYRQLLLELIVALRAQIAVLEEQRALMERTEEEEVPVEDDEVSDVVRIIPSTTHKEDTDRTTLSTPSGLTESEFYDGQYVALYQTDGARLTAIAGHRVEADDQRVWDLFVDIVGEEFAKTHLSEFRIYSLPNAPYDAFIERISTDGRWVLGVNVDDLDLERDRAWSALRDILIHEYGHIIFFYDEQVVDTFTAQFWDSDTVSYRTHPHHFVTEYASTNPLEDTIESFVYFVTRDRPLGNSVQERKVKFFYDYDALVRIRDRLK